MKAGTLEQKRQRFDASKAKNYIHSARLEGLTAVLPVEGKSIAQLKQAALERYRQH